MQQLDKIKQYTSSVCDQIRWKKAHNLISEEIENHIEDQKNAFIAEGLDESEATEKAIEAMGDPVNVGSQLDRTHRPKTEWSMIALTVAMLLLGLAVNLFVKNDIPVVGEQYLFHNVALATIIGIAFMAAAYFTDFTIIGKYPRIIFCGFIIFMLVTSLAATSIYGAKRWISVPFIGTINASTFLLLFATVYAGIIYRLRNKGYLGIILCGVFYVIPTVIFLCIGQGMTNILVYSVSCLILLIISICKGWFNIKRIRGLLTVIVPTVVISIASFAIVIGSSSYRTARFTAWIDPWADPYGSGYTMIVARDMISGAKFFGQGTLPERFANDVSKWLPSINIDYLLTYLIHRIGWISFIVIIALLLAFIIRGFYLCSKQKSVLGGLVSISVLLIFIMHMVVYISGNLGFQLFSPLTLPLISYGGMASIINLSLIGIMLSVFKSGDLVRDSQRTTSDNNHRFLEFVDGKIIIDLGVR